jgi:hypothetical protein
LAKQEIRAEKMKARLWIVALALGWAAGCSCSKRDMMPAPDAPEAPVWSAGSQTADETYGDEGPPRKQVPGMPAPLRGIRYSKSPPRYDLPIDYQIDAPAVPEKMAKPSGPNDLKKK